MRATLLQRLVLAGLVLAGQALAADAPIRVILVGDSTTAVWGGWGPSFCAYHVTSFLACINLARGGRSSGSYRAEGSWAVALNEMRVPGYQNVWVLIQFGHNDQPGKPGRSTDLRTEFPANIRRYVEEVRATGAKPVLVTPLTRRPFKDGKLDNDLEPWAAAIRQAAAEMHVPLLDLNADSAAAVEAMGPAAADRFAELPEAFENAREVTRRAAELEVAFAFFDRDPIPMWVVRDGDVPVFVQGDPMVAEASGRGIQKADRPPDAADFSDADEVRLPPFVCAE